MTGAAGITGRRRAEAERDRLIDELRRAQDQSRADLEAMTRMHELGSLFVREGNLGPVLGKIVDAAIAISGADFGNIQLLDAGSADLRIVAQRGFPDWWLAFWNSVSEGHGVCGTALERRERVIVEDVERSPIFVGTPALEVQLRAGVRAVQSTPLVSRSGKPLGMFSTHWRKPGRPDERSLRLLDLLARHTADIAERAQIEDALRQSEEKLRVSVANAAIGFAVTTREGRFLEANPAYRAITGYGLEELRDMTFLELVAPEDLAANRHQVDRMLAGEIADFVIENRYRRKGGDLVWVRKSISLVRDGLGEPQWMIALVEDVTERKRAEGMVRGTLQRFYGVLSSMENPILLVTNEGRVELANSALCEVFGLKESPDALVGRIASEVVQETRDALPDPDAVIARIEEIVRRGQPVKGEEVTLRAGRTFLRDFVPLSVDGEPRGRLWLHFDITDRKRAEEELREGEKKLRLAKDAAKMGAWNWDLLTGEVTCSDRCKALFGLGPDTVMTWPVVMAAIQPEDRDRVERSLSDAVTRKEPYEIEMRVPRPDGAVCWVAARGEVAYAADGQALRMDGMVMDITERKHAEELARDANEKLREADRQKNQFLAMLSHELRNPLAPIRNGLYILDRASPGGEQARRAQVIIHRQIEQMTWLIDDLLDITRISHGKVELQRERLDLNELAHHTVEDHRAAFVKSEVRLEVQPALAEVWVDGDRVRLAQIIGNLLQNAVKFTPRGGKVVVSIDAAPARDQAALTVRDTGGGIEPGLLPRLFQPFTQADTTLNRSKGGLGLGLAVVKGLVELHGGSVSAASDGPGQGAAFTIRLPLLVTAARATPARRRAGGRRHPRRVLVVEDNEDAANTLREVLELDDHVVEVAYTGREGLEKARAFHPDLVLCDIGLPEMDGYEVARGIRADPRLDDVGLVAVSGYAQPEDVAAAREAGFQAHLAKPPSLEALERAIEEVGRDGSPPGSPRPREEPSDRDI
jgi:PAS domain S-box-containing protein